MTGLGHRITVFTLTGAATGSPVAAFFAALGSVFPDTVEYLIWGSKRNRHHRKTSHWFIPWASGFCLCFFLGAGERLPATSDLFPPTPPALWGCAACWFLGALLHILGDACCGKVPLWVPWKKSFGIRAFEMSSRRGEMSRGEGIFVAFVAITSVAAWAMRFSRH